MVGWKGKIDSCNPSLSVSSSSSARHTLFGPFVPIPISGSKLLCRVTGSSPNPIQQEESADEKREHAVQGVTYGVRMPIDCAKDRETEQKSKHANHGAWN